VILGRIVNGVYVRIDDETAVGARIKDLAHDYFKGVAPSDLGRLDNRQLYTAAERLHESVANNVGTREELAHASEALNAVYHERHKRRATLR
jgi:hypothetical protein